MSSSASASASSPQSGDSPMEKGRKREQLRAKMERED
jgi:hypothetical protein